MAFFNVNSRFQQWVDQMVPFDPCAPGLAWGRAQGNVRCDEAFVAMATDDSFLAGWARWCFEKDSVNLSAELRELLLNAAASGLPTHAVSAWFRLPGLTLEEQRSLRARFYSRDRQDGRMVLPAVEARIRSRALQPVTPDEDIDRGE